MSWVERDAAVSWHPFTQHATEPAPLPVVAAEGARLVLEDGRELLDGISSWWATLHGHGQPDIARAIADQVSRLDHVLFAGATHPGAIELAERLLALAPPGLARAFFSDDGSTAVEVALKMVVQRWSQLGQPQRQVMVALEGGYHGDTFGAMSVGDPDPFFRPFVPLCFEVRRVPVEADALEAALDDLGPRAAGVIFEPLLQGAAGMRMHTAAFLRAARAACDARGLPLIADEVMTGFGRTGHLFACQAAGITPDLLCLAKGLTGGMFPLSVTLATEELYEAFLSDERSQAFFHGHTFTANPVGCAAALASLDVVAREDTPARLAAIGEVILGELAPLEDDPRVRDLRQVGGVVALDLVVPEAGYLSDLGPRLRAAAVERGALLRPLGNVLYAMPPACTTAEEARKLAAILRELVELT
jgi:adenosylmethionine-8-amino-7-oxononanoate aminotransferase